jgi:hypothetical protein
MKVYGGILEEECDKILKEYFKELRWLQNLKLTNLLNNTKLLIL